MNRRSLFLVSSILFFFKKKVISKVVAKRKTYILVHGAWHGGWCWKFVKSILVLNGHKVYTPSLTGLGDRVHLVNKNINLTTHVQDIVNLIKYENLENIILVGHSYAGHVVSLVADRVKDKIAHLVYLDAVLPTNGKAFLPQGVGEERMKVAKHGYLMDIPDIESFLGVPKEHTHYEWLEARLVEHPLSTLVEKVVYYNNGINGICKTFVRCRKNQRVMNGKRDPVKTLIKDDESWNYLLIDTGHDLMVTAPQETADILGQIG